MITQDNITIPERLAAPKPKLFRTLRTISIVMATVGGALLAAPFAPILAVIGGYVLAGSAAVGAVSSLPVDFDKLNQQQEP